MRAYHRYFLTLEGKLKQAFSQETEIQTAAEWIAGTLENQGWIYASGTGHSHLIAEEIFYRAGGFARVRPILIDELMLHKDAPGSTEAERREGFAAEIMKEYPIGTGDIFLISSNSGRNAVSIEMAQLAKSAGAKVIVLTNLAHSKSVKSRHSSGLKLNQVADLVLENFGEIGDAAIELPGLSGKTGATSTVIGAALIQAIMVEAASNLLEKGIQPELFNSSNSDDGEIHNEALLAKYKPLVIGL